MTYVRTYIHTSLAHPFFLPFRASAFSKSRGLSSPQHVLSFDVASKSYSFSYPFARAPFRRLEVFLQDFEGDFQDFQSKYILYFFVAIHYSFIRASFRRLKIFLEDFDLRISPPRMYISRILITL